VSAARLEGVAGALIPAAHRVAGADLMARATGDRHAGAHRMTRTGLPAGNRIRHFFIAGHHLYFLVRYFDFGRLDNLRVSGIFFDFFQPVIRIVGHCLFSSG
jgi:hypothetical protein